MDVLLEILVPVLGLLSAYLLLNLLYDELSLPKLLSGALALYLSLAAAAGYYLSALGLPLSTTSLIAAFGVLALVELIFIRMRRKEGLKLDMDALYLLAFASVILVGLFYLLYPALPSLYPISSSAAVLRHFSAARQILEGQALPAGGYPLGMHLNAALLSNALKLPLIKALYPFSALFAALSAAVLFALIVELTGNKRLSALFSAFFMLFSGYVNHALSISASWEMLFGGFLALVMVWFLAEQGPARRSDLIAPAVIFGGLLLSSPSWALVGLFTFAALQLLESGEAKKKAEQGASLLLLAALLALPALGHLPQGALKCLQGSASIEDPVAATGAVFILLALIGIPSVRGINRALPAFFAAVLAVPPLMFLYSLLSGAGYSGYYTAYFFLYYPMAVFATLGVETLLERWREAYPSLAGERPLAGGMLLLLLLVVGGLVSAQLAVGGQFRGSTSPITPEEYRTASWIKANVPAGEKLTLVNFRDGEDVDWLVEVSGHGTDYGWRWVVIRDFESMPQEKLAQFEVFYQTGGIQVLKRRGIPAS